MPGNPDVFHLIIQDAERDCVLLQASREGWVLPVFSFEETFFWQDVKHIWKEAQQRLGLNVCVIRCLEVARNEHTIHLTYLLEVMDENPGCPAGFRWFKKEELRKLVDENGIQEKEKRIWSVWMQSEVHSLRTAWYRVGWWKHVHNLVRVWSEQAGARLVSLPEQVRSWGRSSLWKISTSDGEFYLKFTPDMFAHEAGVMALLAKRYPEFFPAVVAENPAQGWYLMRSVPGESLESCRDVETWERALQTFAGIQKDLVVCMDEFHALKIPDRRPAVLLREMDELLSNPAALEKGRLGLSEDEISRLQAKSGALKNALKALEQTPVPFSLEHGDFFPGQVLVNDRRITFLDWSDCSISHPFFSLMFLYHNEFELPGGQVSYSRLRAAYLKPWQEYADLETLIRVFNLAGETAPIHLALLYHRCILPRMDVQWEMENMLPYYLRMLMKDGA